MYAFFQSQLCLPHSAIFIAVNERRLFSNFTISIYALFTKLIGTDGKNTDTNPLVRGGANDDDLVQ